MERFSISCFLACGIFSFSTCASFSLFLFFQGEAPKVSVPKCNPDLLEIPICQHLNHQQLSATLHSISQH